jgi:uncharacterized protein YcfJ
MNKKILLSVAIGTAMVLSAGATAGYVAWKNPAYAEVVGVEPVTRIVTTPDKSCRSLQAVQPKAPGGESPGAGIVIDGMAGGAIRHQDADEAANAATSRADLLRGDATPKQAQQKDTYSAGGLRCRAGNRVVTKVIAYDVRYRLHGKTTKVRMDHDPGQRLPVKDGKVILTRDAIKTPDPKA